MPGQKLKLLYLLKILWEETDEENTLSMHEIIDRLNRYSISAERKSLYDDIEKLIFFGVDINTRKGKTTEYFIGQRPFEIPELKLLVDAVQSSNFITPKKSEDLIKKLSNLTSKSQAKSLRRQVYVKDRAKTLNECIYYNVDRLHAAIDQNKQISFKYFHYTITKEKEFCKEGKQYITSPYFLTWDNENYYLIAFSDKYQNYTHYRVDRMSDIEIIDNNRTTPQEMIDIADYSKRVFGMFGGEEETVVLQFDNSLINVVLDRFGQNITLEKAEECTFIVRTKVFVSPTFFAWMFQFGDKAKILSPGYVVKDYVDRLGAAKKLYFV